MVCASGAVIAWKVRGFAAKNAGIALPAWAVLLLRGHTARVPWLIASGTAAHLKASSPFAPAQLYVRLVTDDWAGVQFGDGSGGSDVGRLEQQQQADRVRYLLTCLSRLRLTRADASPPVWEPLVLGVLMQQRLGQLRLQVRRQSRCRTVLAFYSPKVQHFVSVPRFVSCANTWFLTHTR